MIAVLIGPYINKAMKKILYFGMLLSACTNLQAQTQKGRWQVGMQVGNITYRNHGKDASKSWSARFTPTAGYFVAKNLLIGTGIPFSINYASVGQSGSYFQGDDALNTSLGLSPFIRYYFGEARLKPYLGGSYSYLYKTYKYTNSTVPIPDVLTTAYSTVIAPSIGLAYFMSQHIAFNIDLSYNISQDQIPSFRYINTNGTVEEVIVEKNRTESKFLLAEIGFQLYFGK